MTAADLALLIPLFWMCRTLSEMLLRKDEAGRKANAVHREAAKFAEMPRLDVDGPKVGPLPAREHKVETSFEDRRIGGL